MRSTSPLLRAVVIAGALALAATAAADPAGSIAFVSPRPLSPAIGPTTIELRVEPPAGRAVEQVVVSVEGDVVGTLTAPPWRILWDAGDGDRARRITATAVFTGGATARATLTVDPLVIHETSEVSLVSFYATVRDRSGDYVRGLGPGDFVLTENGRTEQIERFESERKPLTVAIVLDSSLSMLEQRGIQEAKEASLAFLKALEPADRAMVATFNDGVHIVQPLTSDRGRLVAAIEGIEAGGGTALYDAIWTATGALADVEGRRVLVLLSDGRDEAQSGLEPGSVHTVGEALDRALRNEVMIFAIGFGKIGTEKQPVMDFYGRQPLRSILASFAQTTGGQVLFPDHAGELRAAFTDVSEALRNQYSIAYTSDDERRDGSWRETRLVPRNRALTVTTRRGYFAPKDGTTASLLPAPAR